MSYRDLYTIRKLVGTELPSWQVDKVDKDGLPAGGYTVTKPGNYFECPCFASNRHTCRHRDMVRMYEMEPDFKAKMDNHWLYNFDKDKWQEPVKVDEV